MRRFTVILIAAALGCGVGCRKQEATDKADQRAETDLYARWHFVGTASLANNTNAVRLRELWSLPETRRLAEQTLQKLAHAPRTFYGERIAAAEDERGAALLRPMLDDLLAQESCLQVRGPADKTAEWTLLVQLPADRRKVWRAGLAELMQLWKLGAPSTNAVEGFAAWEVNRTEAPSRVRCVEAGQWLVLGLGQNNLPGVSEAARLIKTGRRPVPVASNYWFETELNLPRLATALHWSSAFQWPRAKLTVIGRGENLRSNMRMVFPEPVTGPLDAWRVPTNFINEPLISFTAARGVAPWLKNCAALRELELNPAPNELFAWAQAQVTFQSFLGFPLKDAATKLERAGNRASSLLSTNWRSRGLAQISWQTNNHQVF